MLRGRPARLAQEGQEHQPPAVEAGQQGREDADREGEAADAGAAGEGALDDRVLRIEAGEAEAGPARHLDDADAGDGERADQHRPEGERDLLPQRAVEAHVLLVVHGVDHRAGAEEQQGLEEGVGEEVEHRRAIGADAGGEEHVAQLRAGRISDHPLDVVLDRADGGGEDGGGGADRR